jgi:hypothetical protein
VILVHLFQWKLWVLVALDTLVLERVDMVVAVEAVILKVQA